MKKFIAILCIILCFASLAGCTNSPEPVKEADPPRIEDLVWTSSGAVIWGEPCLSFNYTNNSSYTIIDVEIEFRFKDDVTPEQLAVYEGVIEELDSFYVVGSNRKFAEPGETVKRSPFCIRGTYTLLSDQELLNLMEPSNASVAYIGADKLMHGFYYDYKADMYYEYEETPALYEWSDGAIAKRLPKPDFDVVTVNYDDEDGFAFEFYNVSEEAFTAYCELCKEAGFDIEIDSNTISYSADNLDGYELYMYYDNIDETVTGSVE